MNNAIQNQIIQIIELTLGLRPVEMDVLLIETYGAESADIANIVVAVEQKFGVHIPESTLPALKTARDFYHLVQNAR